MLSKRVNHRYPGFTTRAFFSQLPVRKNAIWTPQRLTWSALLMGLSEQQTLGERFAAVTQFLKTTCPHWSTGTSYDGWVRALHRESLRLLPLVIGKLRSHMNQFTDQQQIGRWKAFGVDGSDATCPRTELNQATSSGKGQHNGMPLLSMTVMYHLRLGLPWAFRVGPCTESERSHLDQMLDELPRDANSLIVADAGFPGYACCRNMLEKQRHFLLRVGGNMHLLKDLGYEHAQRGDLVYLWPLEQQARKQRPLTLRLIVIHDEGKQPIYLVTSVLDQSALTAQEARDLYHFRWKIEVFYRETKQTMEHDGVNSRTPSNCYLEMTWALLSIWFLKLMVVRQLIAAGKEPRKISVAKSRDLVRRVLRNGKLRGNRSFYRSLQECQTDNYRRTKPKASRNYPRKKRHKPPEPPQIQLATETQRKLAKGLTPLIIKQ